jgi:hypothetical protein
MVGFGEEIFEEVVRLSEVIRVSLDQTRPVSL